MKNLTYTKKKSLFNFTFEIEIKIKIEMETNYNQLTFNLSENDFFNVQGYYELKMYGLNYQKRVNLSYKILKSPGSILLEDFMSEYFEKILLNSFLKLQSKHVYWQRMIINTPSKQFKYVLPSNIKGHIDSLLFNPSNSYKFEIQRESGRNVCFKLYGIPLNIDDRLIENFKKMVLNPLILEKSDCILELN